MTRAKELLEQATSLPWESADDPNEMDNPADAALIVYAVNRLPDYEAAVDALERLLSDASNHDPYNDEPVRLDISGRGGPSSPSLSQPTLVGSGGTPCSRRAA